MGCKKNIIACRIFENEIKAVVSKEDLSKYHWIDAALHADPVKMKAAISSVISELESSDSKISFLFGNGCHPDMCAIAEDHGVNLPDEKNCIDAFLGPDKARELEQNRTMIISPGWLKAWPDIMQGLGWDVVDTRINLGRYDRILLLDPGLIPIDDEALIAFYDLVQVPVEIMEIDLEYFTSLIEEQ